MKEIKQVLVDNHQIIIDGLKYLLSEEPDIIIEGEASNGLDALEKISRLQPDIVITDLSMPKMGKIQAFLRGIFG